MCPIPPDRTVLTKSSFYLVFLTHLFISARFSCLIQISALGRNRNNYYQTFCFWFIRPHVREKDLWFCRAFTNCKLFFLCFFIICILSNGFFLAEWPFSPCWFITYFLTCFTFFVLGLIHTSTQNVAPPWTLCTSPCCLYLQIIVWTDECCTFGHLEMVTNKIHGLFTGFVSDFIESFRDCTEGSCAFPFKFPLNSNVLN